jgi:hypothetical protein
MSLSVWIKPAPTGMIFMKLAISIFFENITKIADTLQADRYTYTIETSSVLLRMSSFPE